MLCAFDQFGSSVSEVNNPALRPKLRTAFDHLETLSNRSSSHRSSIIANPEATYRSPAGVRNRTIGPSSRTTSMSVTT